ncbi:hypothetical protein NE237_006467 [Protea cynaroides]|uniref:NF-X1-type domain-containing protein n=1 Tax=Protea cynaroides TaxID=273540 RepID=A0A9Q0KMB8_9MAGN|nr:hypothetical protein NE237_006467 [Protea cynaroides]
MICIGIVSGSATIWSCSNCYSIFHLNCIKKWARAPTSVEFSAEKNQGVNWRCPGCQSLQLLTAKMIQYACFCGKGQDPPMDLYRTARSCGEPCLKPLEKEVAGAGNGNDDDRCPHVCILQCHPGPCPPCKAFTTLCPRGKKTFTMRCSDRKSMLITCEESCNKLLECGRHRCEQICHHGPCDPCPVLIKAFCFCNKKEDALLCGEMVVKGDMRQIDGVYSCNSACDKKLDCGKHFCGENCHPGPCGDCKLTPCIDDSYPILTCSQIYDRPTRERCKLNNEELISDATSAIAALVKSVSQLEHNAKAADAARTKAEEESRAAAIRADQLMEKVKRLTDARRAEKVEKALESAKLENADIAARADEAEERLKAVELEKADIAARADEAKKDLKVIKKKLKVAEEKLKVAELEKTNIAARAVAGYKESSAFKKDAFAVAKRAFVKYCPDFVHGTETEKNTLS